MEPSDCESDFSDAETVQIDTEVPDDLDGDAGLESDGLQYYEDTQPVDDDAFLLADAYETQKVDDLAAETQPVDDCGGTQVLNLGSDTQVVDDRDDLKSDETEVLCDTQKISDDDSERKYGSQSGFTVRGFTSIRVASIRQSGSAARKRGINNTSQKTESEKNDTQVEELRNENTGKIGCSAARKLFMDDDEVTEILQAGDDMENSVDSEGMHDIEVQHNPAGLSYISSQEPGDLSQAYALDVVNRFIELNPVEVDQDVTSARSFKEISKPISIAKGTQSLAKKVTVRRIDEERGAFQWDDDVEDEGGGEFFQKKKELFFGKNGAQRKRSTGNLKKTSCLKSKCSLTAPQNRGRKQIGSNIKLNDAIFSDSKLLAKNCSAVLKSSELKEPKLQKNLLEELNAEMDITDDRQVDAGCDEGFPVNQDVGIDTQMAADAMETLQFAVTMTEDVPSHFDKGTGNMTKSSDRSEVDGELQSLDKSSTKKRALGSKAKVITRQSKRTNVTEDPRRRSIRSSSQQSRNACNQSVVELPVRKSKRAQGELKNLVVDHFEKPSHVSREAESRKEDEVPVATHHCEATRATASSGKKSLKSILEKEICSLTPIIRRTRSSVRRSRSKGEDDKNSSADQTNVRESGDVNLRQAGQSNTSSRRKRTRSELADFSQRGSIQYNTRSTRSKTGPAGPSLDADRTISDEMVDNDRSHIKDSIVKSPISRHSGAKKTAEREKASRTREATPTDRSKPHAASVNTTPISNTTSINAVSPICMGDEYLKQSCRKNLLSSSFIRGLSKTPPCSESTSATKDLRKRRDFGEVRAIFSRHLDADIVKHQKKILARFGASVASLMSDATHFITDKFVRTNNMLEAIAYGKPVVTHLWLESCARANCFIDEKSHVLRDAKKEREFGFCMPVSLARAREHPLLQGQRVLVTPNTKPGREILAGLVRAVHGVAVERLGRSVLNNERFPEDILVLSCEEDYEICVPFLEKGAMVYSSELLLNGIVTQRLDYARHSLFVDRVKRTRSTIWLKKNDKYLPVSQT